MNTNYKISKKELQNILGVSYPTALKEYQTCLDTLNNGKKYLTKSDLYKLQILEKI